MTRGKETKEGGKSWLRPIFTPSDTPSDTPECRLPIYELVTGGAKKGALGSLMDGKGDKQVPLRMLSFVEAVSRLGYQTAISSGRLKHLNGDVFEIKHKSINIRAFCILTDGGNPVLVIDRVVNTKGGMQTDYERLIKLTNKDADLIKRLVDQLN